MNGENGVNIHIMYDRGKAKLGKGKCESESDSILPPAER